MWSPYWSILVCKIPQFWARLPIQTMHHTFLESRHPEVTINPYYVLSREWSQKKVSAHGLKVIGVSDVLTWVACYYYCYCYYWSTDNLEKKVECLLLRQKWKNVSNTNRSEQWFKRRTWLEELVLLYINWTGNATILDIWLPMWTNMLRYV